MGKVRADSRYSAIGLINLDEKQTGAPSAGNPHAGCEVAGAGNRLTVRILRHFQRKREATARLNLRGNGASPRPYRWILFGRHGCAGTSSRSGSADAGACAGFSTQCVRRWRCRAFSVRHESSVLATTDWRRPFARSIGGVLRGTGATSTPTPRVGQPGPEPPESFALPTNNGACLDIEQSMLPVGPYAAESGPEYPIQGGQRALPFSLKRRDLHSQRCILHSNRLMSAEEQADESKHQQ